MKIKWWHVAITAANLLLIGYEFGKQIQSNRDSQPNKLTEMAYYDEKGNLYPEK